MECGKLNYRNWISTKWIFQLKEFCAEKNSKLGHQKVNITVISFFIISQSYISCEDITINVFYLVFCLVYLSVLQFIKPTHRNHSAEQRNLTRLSLKMQLMPRNECCPWSLVINFHWNMMLGHLSLPAEIVTVWLMTEALKYHTVTQSLKSDFLTLDQEVN